MVGRSLDVYDDATEFPKGFLMVRLAAEQLGPQVQSLLDRIGTGEAITLTRNGKPVAVIRPVSDAVENLRQLQAEAEASGGANMTDEEIDALIAAVRQDRHRRTG